MARRRMLLCLVLCLFLLPSTALAAGSGALDQLPRWNIVTSIATYSGPSHADVLFRINDIMPLMQSDPGIRLSDFEEGMPLSMRVHWNYLPALGFSATYSTSSYSSANDFEAHSWSSPRELTTRLHELGLALHYGLDFVRSQKLLPYVGGGAAIVMADSKLSIDLLNVQNLPPFDPDDPTAPDYPDQHFLVKARDATVTYFGMAGLIYRFTNRVSLSAEVQGIMGDIRQDFDYSGSLQHVNPGTPQNQIDDWSINDILGGAYPLDLNGIRLSVGVMVGL